MDCCFQPEARALLPPLSESRNLHVGSVCLNLTSASSFAVAPDSEGVRLAGVTRNSSVHATAHARGRRLGHRMRPYHAEPARQGGLPQHPLCFVCSPGPGRSFQPAAFNQWCSFVSGSIKRPMILSCDQSQRILLPEMESDKNDQCSFP